MSKIYIFSISFCLDIVLQSLTVTHHQQKFLKLLKSTSMSRNKFWITPTKKFVSFVNRQNMKYNFESLDCFLGSKCEPSQTIPEPHRLLKEDLFTAITIHNCEAIVIVAATSWNKYVHKYFLCMHVCTYVFFKFLLKASTLCIPTRDSISPPRPIPPVS
jgi:hypothetical protein